MRAPIQIHVEVSPVDFSSRSRSHRAVVLTSAQCICIGNRINFSQLRVDCESALTGLHLRVVQINRVLESMGLMAHVVRNSFVSSTMPLVAKILIPRGPPNGLKVLM